MNIQYFYPSGILSQYIKYIWTLETCPDDRDVSERVLPTGTIEVMFHFKKTLKVNKSNGEKFIQPRSFISGLSSTFADVTADDEIGMIAVEFKPLGANYFFNVPLKEIEEQIIPLNVFDKININSLENLIFESPEIEFKVKIIEDYLLHLLKEKNKKDISMVNECVRLINLNKGIISVDTLSKKLLISPRNLERKFSDLIGKTPKQFSKIIRFQNIMNSIRQTDNINLTNIALDNGYFDQAHFIKDFKSFTGLSPKKFCDIYMDSGY